MHVKRLILARESENVPIRKPVPGVVFFSFEPSHLHDHAIALAQSFQYEADLAIYPSLGTEHGTRDLLQDMTSLPQFCPAATWLAKSSATTIGTIQALINPVTGEGEIQNVGVVPGNRRRGIGRALVARSIASLMQLKCRRITLEVSAANESALALYRNFGFQPYKTIYTPIRSAMAENGAGI